MNIRSTIKTLQVALFFTLAIVATSCKKDKNDINGTGKKGTFTIDGISYNGNTEVQTFVNDNYSVVCQQDDPFKLIQVTFHNQAEAEAGGTFTVDDYRLNIASGTVNIGVDGLTYDPNGSFNLTVSGKKITISGNIKLDQTGSGGGKPTVNNASINF